MFFVYVDCQSFDAEVVMSTTKLKFSCEDVASFHLPNIDLPMLELVT